MVSAMGTYLPGVPVNCSATKNGCDRKRSILRARATASLSSSDSSSMPEDGDDVLQVLVALQHLLHLARDLVVLLADDVRVEDARAGRQRIDGRVDAAVHDRARQVRGRVEVREGGGRRRVGVVVGWHVDRLHGGDRAPVGRGDALLQLAHLREQRRLVADGRGHAAQQRRDLGARLREAEDVVDEEEDVLALRVAEVLGHGQRGERHAQARARRLRHLAVDQRRPRLRGVAGHDDAALLELEPEVVALARAFADAAEHRDTAVLQRDVVDQLLDDDGLADARAAEQADLAALQVRLDQVNDLDARLEHLQLGGLVRQHRGRPMDRPALLRVHGPIGEIHRAAEDVQHAAERFGADGHGDGPAQVERGHAALHPVGRLHGDRAHAVLAEVLLDLRDDVDLRLALAKAVGDHADGVVDGRQVPDLELDVDHGPDDGDDLADLLRACLFHVSHKSQVLKSQVRV